MTLADFLQLAPRGDLWIFGYGSLMWAPGFRYRERRAGHVHGYHRSLCVYSHRYRGSPKRPGLVVGLCAGGSCWGIAYRVRGAHARRVLEYLWRREMRNRVYAPRFVRARVEHARTVRALAFVANEAHPQFAGDLDAAHMARLVADGSGVRGHNIEYLRRTLVRMLELGVPDPHLERVLREALALRGRRRARENAGV
jgi:cation transport protein ChaC